MISPLIGRLLNCSAAAAALMVVTSVLPASVATAQPARFIQVGAAVIPGIGIQGGYVAPRSFFTVEGIIYVDGSPRFAGGEGSVQVSGGLGGAVRILGILRTIGSPRYVGRDIDVGMRFGPSLFFTFGAESSRAENPFGLFLEPFVRATSDFGGNRIFFLELGIQRPVLRAGVWFDI